MCQDMSEAMMIHSGIERAHPYLWRRIYRSGLLRWEVVSAQCPLFLLTVVCVPTVHNPSKWSAAYLEYLHHLIIKDASQHEDVELGQFHDFPTSAPLGCPMPAAAIPGHPSFASRSQRHALHHGNFHTAAECGTSRIVTAADLPRHLSQI